MIERYKPGETPAELREKYNPEGSVLRQAQMRMLEMLLYLDGVCKKLDIDYRLDGGNVLGAVRHGGFIPWDDDVDIVIENKKDYKKLCKFLLEQKDSNYVLQCRKTDKGFFQTWNVLRDTHSEYIQNAELHNIRKYRGLQIDIFPMEPKRIVLLNRICAKIAIKIIDSIERKKMTKAKLLYYFMHILLIPIFNVISFVFGNPNYYMHSYGDFWTSRRHKDVLLPHSTIIFEGHFFPAPAKPHDFLASLYKNYLNLPPESKRDHHKASYKIW